MSVYALNSSAIHIIIKVYLHLKCFYVGGPMQGICYKQISYITTRGGVMIEFSEMRGPNKIFGSFCEINEPNILFGTPISENSIVKPPLVKKNVSSKLSLVTLVITVCGCRSAPRAERSSSPPRSGKENKFAVPLTKSLPVS